MKLLTDRHYNREAGEDHKFQDLGSVLILVEFEDIRDKERVKREEPWSFDMSWCWLKILTGNNKFIRFI